MRSSKRVLGLAVATIAVAGLVVLPSAAQAQSCTPVPVSSTGVTIGTPAGDVRVPSISGVAVCFQGPGITGTPWVETEPGGGASVVIRGSSGADGYVILKYSSDGNPTEIGAPLPGSGGGGETCLLGVGFPARSDCAFKISPDSDPLPTIPPIPTVEPEPLPTIPTIPTIPPIPTVEPEPLPTIPPVPDDVCVNTRICLSTLPEIIERLPEIIDNVIELVVRTVTDALGPIACNIPVVCD